ncbi:MAG: hypothetical protein AAGD38_04185 [Acidobacteriota bacterium]
MMHSLRARLVRFLPSLLLGLISLTVAVAFAEIAVRMVAPQPREEITPGLYEADPPRRFRLQPGHEGTVSNLVEFQTSVSVDDRGLRRGTPEATSDDALRIVAIGDSFTFGWGVEGDEAFAARIPAYLDRTGLDRAVTTLNGGVAGWGLPDMVDWLEAYGLALEPDVVLLCIFLGNDLLDATEVHRQIDMAEGLVAAAPRAGGYRQAVQRNLHVARLAKRALPPGLQAKLRGMVGLAEPWAITYLRDRLRMYANTPDALAAEGRQVSAEALDRLLDLTTARGIKVAAVFVPSQLEVDDDYWDAMMRAFEVDPTTHAQDVPATFFATRLAYAEVPTLDLTPAFRDAHDAGQDLYFRYDPHWTVAGHELAAQEIGAFLDASGLLEPTAEPEIEAEGSI